MHRQNSHEGPTVHLGAADYALGWLINGLSADISAPVGLDHRLAQRDDEVVIAVALRATLGSTPLPPQP